MLTLYDAARCPYCARVRILLAEKGLSYEPIEIDLDDRPAWIYEKNPLGRVPVLEEDSGLVLPESRVIMEYLEERFPEPAFLPADPAERALARLALEQFSLFSDPYYDLYWNRPAGTPQRVYEQLGRLDEVLAKQQFLSGSDYGLTDIGYIPWILRTESRLGLEFRGQYPELTEWVEQLERRPAIAAESDVVAAI